jgi:DNA-directed RNA polymerase specialized sigma24 family protein
MKSKNQTFISIHSWSKIVWTELVRSKQANNRDQFNQLMLQAVPELNKYVASRLKIALKKGGIPANKYKVDDFVNELFVAAYDEFSNFDSAKAFSNWLYIRMDQLIEDKITDEDFDDFFFSDFGNYSEKEWIALEQKIDLEDTTGKMDDYVPLEEVHRSNAIVLAEIFKSVEEQKQLERLSEHLSESEIAAHMDVVHYHLSTPAYSSLNLITLHQVDPKDVAFIKNKSEADFRERNGANKKTNKIKFCRTL